MDMKKQIAIFLFSLMLLNGYSQNAPTNSLKKGKKITSATFSGHWKGPEKCQDVSSPLSTVTIITSGPSSVLITGIYSTQGRIKGIVKDDVLTIPLQQVNDPNFTNLALEATITLSDDRQSLIVRFSVQNNNMKDACTAVYKK
jgi:hypothetical protein